jgi:hypothetical protein
VIFAFSCGCEAIFAAIGFTVADGGLGAGAVGAIDPDVVGADPDAPFGPA